MSLLINGIKKPARCIDCVFMVSRSDDDCILQSDKANAKAKSWDDMMSGCPLIEVPLHGRLIDADFEEAHYASMTINPTPDVTAEDKRKSLVVIEALQMAGTVIPAERGE